MRRHGRNSILLVAAVLVVSAAEPAFADALLEYRGAVEGSGRVSLFVAPGKMRVDGEERGGASGSVLYDEVSRRMWIVDHSRRMYVEVDDHLLRQMRQLRQQMEAQLSRLPVAIREQMERSMIPPGFTRVQGLPEELCEGPKVLGTETVRGVPAKVVDGCKSLLADGVVICRFWVADGRELGLDPEDFRVLESFLTFYLETVKTVGLPEVLGGSGLLLTQPRRNAILQLGVTFPVVVKAALVGEGRESRPVFLERVSTEPLPTTLFAPPPGYKKVEFRLQGTR